MPILPVALEALGRRLAPRQGCGRGKKGLEIAMSFIGESLKDG